ncbi:MAG TPA: GNAT family N-acetyltransferase, partial [Acidovorax sp.]|nr:GNAT family N-acetyltransferase [Acidovorax sp.]
TLWEGQGQDAVLVAACPLYLKSHSYGEYVFDWAWASAYEQHGVPYYPKAVIAVPFTPVPGSRLLARDEAARALLVQAVVQWCEQENLSSVHVLFASDDDVRTSAQQDLMLRHTVQFHWKNVAPTLGTDVSSLPPEGALAALGRPGGGSGSRFESFDHFLSTLAQDKRKKIRQERRRVAEAGVTFRWARGTDICAADWDFFYRCYERTYLEHGNPPYLTRDFFARMADRMPEAWLLFVAERDDQPIASSLIAIGACSASADGQNSQDLVAYGRYWGALQRVDCLHFEACYYQPLQWCIEHGVARFEGGAQGEHKMARALLPVQATSAHWLAHPAFAEAVERFLKREGTGIRDYLDELNARSPFRQG